MTLMVIGHEVSGGRVQDYGFGGNVIMVGAAMPLPLQNTKGGILGRKKVIIMWGAFRSHKV